MTISIFSSPNIDMKTVGDTAIFMPTSDFMVTAINFIAVDLTGTIGGANVNLGNNSPTFNNFISSLHTSVNSNNHYQYYGLSGSQVNTVVSGGSAFTARVVTPDSSATTNTQRIDILGYYI